jgi:ABC-type nitrate/sulfonate/bicarbonate transport system permease component
MSIPGISWAPVFIILIGFGDITIISVGILTAFFPVVYNIFHGIRESDKSIVFLGDLFEYNFIEKMIKINIPAIMNYLVIALKLAFARTWRTIIAVEMIAATTMGLGYMIFDARELINTKLMFSGILISGIIFIIIETGIKVLEKLTVVRWGMKIES